MAGVSAGERFTATYQGGRGAATGSFLRQKGERNQKGGGLSRRANSFAPYGAIPKSFLVTHGLRFARLRRATLHPWLHSLRPLRGEDKALVSFTAIARMVI